MSRRGFVIDFGGIQYGDEARGRIDGKTATRRIAGYGISYRSAAVGRECSNTDARAVPSAFRHGVSGGVAIHWRRRRPIGDADVEDLRIDKRAVAGLRIDLVDVPGRTLVIDLAAVLDGDHAGRGIDLEAAARGVADQRPSHPRSVDIGGGRGDADGRAVRSAFPDGVGSSTGIDRRRGSHVVDADRKGLLAAEVIIFGGAHSNAVGVTRRGLEVDLAGIGDRHHTGIRVDLETATGIVGGQRIGERRIAVGKSRVRCNTDGGIDRSTFRNGVGGVVGVLWNGRRA